jgi:hypothetical protein
LIDYLRPDRVIALWALRNLPAQDIRDLQTIRQYEIETRELRTTDG